MENSNDTFKVIGAIIIGATIGSVIGVLFAPNKGTKTRSNLLSGAKNLGEDLKQQMKDEILPLRSKTDEIELLAEEKIAEMSDSVRYKVDVLLSHN